MEDEKLEQMLKDGPEEESSDEEILRTPVTILFSDIKGSTSYFEQHGDIKGMEMVERHNSLLFPCIEEHDGRVVKTIGDAIMASFNEPVDAIRAAVDMQRALQSDAAGREEGEQIHVKIGIHTGYGLLRDNDIFGDVVNAAARIQGESEPDQILITHGLLDAADVAGFQIARLGRAELRGKDEPIDLFAVGWSPAATQKIIDDLLARSEDELQEERDARLEIEEEFDIARDEWREERRRLNAEIERLEEEVVAAEETVREQVTGELEEQMQLKVDAAEKNRMHAEEDLKKADERFDAEREGYKIQIADLERRIVEAMEQMNNPSRLRNQVREQVEKRLEYAKQQWQAQANLERKRLEDQIERLKNSTPEDPIAAARRKVMEQVKAKQAGGEGPAPEPDLEQKLRDLEHERDELKLQVANLQEDVQNAQDSAREEVYDEMRMSFHKKLEQAEQDRNSLKKEVRSLTEALASEKEDTKARILRLEEALVDAERRAETTTGARSELEAELEQSERSRERLERRFEHAAEEWQVERAQLEKVIAGLEASVEEAKKTAFKRSSGPSADEIALLRRQMEEEFKSQKEAWEEEKRRLLQRSSEPSTDDATRPPSQLEQEFERKREAWEEEKRRLLKRIVQLEDAQGS